MPLYEVSFVASVDVFVADGDDPQRFVQRKIEEEFDPDRTNEVNVTRVERLHQCVCCDETLDRWVPPEFDTRGPYCYDCSRGKCAACREVKK